MGSNVGVFIWGENDGTLRQDVPDFLMHMTVNWTDNAGQPQTFTRDEYLLPTLNWLRTTYPNEFKRQMEDVVIRIARLRYGVDSTVGLD